MAPFQSTAQIWAFPFAVAAFAAHFFTDLPRAVSDWVRLASGSGDEDTLIQLDDAADIAPLVEVNVFIDIAGDPAILRIDNRERSATIAFAEGSGVLDVQRFGCRNRIALR